MSEKTRLIVIAGPQSSGKTTIMNLLEKKYPHIPFIEETNQFTVVDKNHLGGAYVDNQTERQINDVDIAKIKEIDRSRSALFMETGILHTTYAEYYCDEKTAQSYLEKYIKAHEGLDPIIFFIDTKPQISWKRRRKTYIQRIDRAGVTDVNKKKEMLEFYRTRIINIYHLWNKYFRLIPFEKYMIKNSYKSWERFEKEIMGKIKTHTP
ncbi:AAA family ATPase [Candidatus Roizmanbacteria bacterium]|nr:AAA family ATPase [Candidatus Roizmanbacteria bacterium]